MFSGVISVQCVFGVNKIICNRILGLQARKYIQTSLRRINRKSMHPQDLGKDITATRMSLESPGVILSMSLTE